MLVACTGNMATPDLHWLVIGIPWHAILIIVILDNFLSHRTENVAITAELLDNELVFLPPYSPHLNPIELIWKSIKKVISRTFVKDQEMMIDLVKTNFNELSKSKSFCKNWVETFVN